MEIFSHSRLGCFEQCPLRYKYRYIDKIKVEFEQTIEGFLGNIVHNALEWFYRELIKGRTPQIDELIEFYSRNWMDKYTTNISVIKQNISVKDYFNRGVTFLIDYYNKNKPFKNNTIETEKKIIIDLDGTGNYLLQGYIDRLDFNPETNEHEIHDYKTGSILPSKEDLEQDRQLALYSLGISKEFKNPKIRLIWHFLAHNHKISIIPDETRLSQLKIKIIELINKIRLTRIFEPKRSLLCDWCEFKGMCSSFSCQKSQVTFDQIS